MFLMIRPAYLALLFSLYLSIAPLIVADETAPSDAPVSIEKVSLFKNGLGYFNASATLPDGATTVRLGQLPVPSLGTFWVAYPEDVKLHSLVTGMEEFEDQRAVQSIADLLYANVGRHVTLYMANESLEPIRGTILPFASTTPSTEANPYFMGGRSPDASNSQFVPPAGGGQVVMIRTDTTTVAVNPHTVVSAHIDGGDVSGNVPMPQKRPAIRMDLDAPAAGQEVSVSYLARGITWSPAYLIDLSDPDTARFSARALIINEVADLDNVELELITGFPNIKFSDVVSPIAQSQRLAEYLEALVRGASEGNRQANMMAQQAIISNNAFFFDSSNAIPLPAYSTAAQGAVSEDLFLYPVDRLTLKRGETAWIPLFSADMPYEHIYTWKIADFLDAEGRNIQQPVPPDSVAAEEVWHSCRIVNALDMPLTTAPAEFVTNGAFTGQDICYYTAPGADTTIRINRAMNVLAEQAEIETDRVMNASTFQGWAYDLVTLRGELRVRNRQDKSVNVEITKELSGKVLKSTPTAKDVQTGKGLKQTNPKHVLTWEIELAEGEEKNLSYEYQVYVRK
jgi:hypothetical protein